MDGILHLRREAESKHRSLHELTLLLQTDSGYGHFEGWVRYCVELHHGTVFEDGFFCQIP